MNIIPYGKQTIDDEDIASVIEVLKSDYLTTGPKVQEFENEICKYTEAKYCVCVSNGTAALHLASLVLLKENDKVLTTVNSFLATSNSILYVNAKPIFIDICEDGNIDLDMCEEYLKRDNTITAIYAVHFSGNMVDQKKLEYLKRTYNIKIVEDCAHSLGAVQNNIKAGSCKNSSMSILSFHPVKNLTTGEGGAITTNCIRYYEKLIQLRNHGMVSNPEVAPWHYDMTQLGFNYRLTDISCALGLSQLKKLNSFLKKRKILAKRYAELLGEYNGIKPLYKFTNESAYHLYVMKINFEKFKISKKNFFLKMREKNIFLQYHYIPINQQPYYKSLGFGKEFTPNMDIFYEQALSFPIFPNLSFEEQSYVVDSMKEILNG